MGRTRFAEVERIRQKTNARQRGMDGPLSIAELNELRGWGFAKSPLIVERLFLTVEELLAGRELAQRPVPPE